ncbi:penicillin-binding protein 2 [Phenylobacterium sp.]|uniref:peptidoglycan D,D-transpeptidase FtsI family protein n=1 Tax=Phenylobacterium sp. TaxID=1871053 RepID=UPI00273098F4|nr:penicillin-binding protein 2 [Phenylobacterium sp.]MDP1618810.1 penicillin-binding protein 2 [Phenylobacterium sp.]
MSLGGGVLQRRFPFGLRWLGAGLWRLEHAFERARASGRAEDDARIRIFFVMVLFSLGFVALAIGAAQAALFSDAARGGGAGWVSPQSRADIVDRHGRLLAADLPHYGLYVDPSEVWDVAATRVALRAALPSIDDARLERALTGDRRTFLTGGMTPVERAAIHRLGLPGISFEPEQKRVYPLNNTAAHLIGFADTGGEGLAGAELALNDQIRNLAGAGGEVALSIDLRVQGALEDELRKAALTYGPRGAVGIVANVHTGELLGVASYPDFDPNNPGAASPEARLNRAASAVFEMGSTFKAFTVAVGLDAGVATMASTFDAREPFKLGYRTISDYHASRKILTLVEVFQHSSNIGTAKLAVGVGPERLSRYFTDLGLTTAAEIELKESASPLTPKVWNEDAVASTSFGHGMNVSPLALTRAMLPLLNGGKLVPLTIHKREPGFRPPVKQVLSETTSAQMLQIMRANVTGGSGGKADAPGLSVGGKTGTGEKYDPEIRRYNGKRQVSSFAAVFPTDGPLENDRYFVLILLDEPHGTPETFGYSTGGWVAAPATGQVIARIAPFLGVSRHVGPMENQPRLASVQVPVMGGDL